ncbi:hypothetical protein ACTXT7_003416 [Hymenolepis weldensis]
MYRFVLASELIVYQVNHHEQKHLYSFEDWVSRIFIIIFKKTTTSNESLKNIELKWGSSYVNLFNRVGDTAVNSISAEIEFLIREAPSQTILLSNINTGNASSPKDLGTKSEKNSTNNSGNQPNREGTLTNA